jgi:hypothetical protein
MCTMFRLVGTTRLRTNSLYLMTVDRADRNLGAAPHQVEQADTKISREALVDDLQRGHTPTHDALLPADIVGTDSPSRLFGAGLLGLTGYAAK